MYENQTFEVILQRMLDRVPDSLDKREGSIIYDALAPAAVELATAYIEFDTILNESFADTASREYLIRRCAERGIEPEPTTNAILQGDFTPTNIDVLGQRFNLNKLNYVVTELIEAGRYKVKCETVGAVGNENLGAIIPIDYIEGLETAELSAVLIPGEDAEATEALRDRYFASFNEKPYGGNRQDYLNETNSIAGVGSTKVTPVWNGGGTVKLTILDSNFDVASQTLIDTVKNTIDPYPNEGYGYGIAPIGHVVTVDTADEITVNIAAALTYDTGYSWATVAAEVTELFHAYMLELRQAWADQSYLLVRIAELETRILAVTGILDIQNLTINGASSNLILAAYEIPIAGTINMT